MRKCITLLVFFLVFLSRQSNAQEIQAVKVTDLEKIIRESKTPMIINFWATWCRPCIEEIPYFQEEVEKYKKDSVQLILVSIDFKEEYPEGIEKMAEKRKFNSPIYWLNESNADYFCPRIDSKWSGAVPASLFINNKKGYRKFFEEQIPREKFEQAIRTIL